MKQDLLIEGVITPRWFQAKPSDPVRCSSYTELRLAFRSSSSHATEEGFWEVEPASQGPIFGNKGSLVFTRRCRCAGTENTPDCLGTWETPCLGLAQLDRLRAPGHHRTCWDGIGPRCALSSAHADPDPAEHPGPTPKTGIEQKADLGYIS